MITVHTDKPVAVDSHDHVEPKGTANDNLHNEGWVDRMIEYFGRSNINFLDLGTAGGGLVKDFLDKGAFAVGIDGSDYSKIHGRGEWGVIPDNLHTADITEPFWVKRDGERVFFDLITSWDVLEHIPEEKLEGVLNNIYGNLRLGGITMHSIAEFEDEGYHVTLKPADWWVDLFERSYFERVEMDNDKFARHSSHHLAFKKV